MTPERKLEYATRMLRRAAHEDVHETCELCKRAAEECVLPILEQALSEHGEDVMVEFFQSEARKP